MPNASVHRKITIISQIVTLPAVFMTDFGVFCAFQAGILTTYLVNPDADIAQKLGLLGDVVGYEDYESAMPHRFGLSHSHWEEYGWKMVFGSHIPLFGTMIRLLPILILSGIGMVLLGAHGWWTYMLPGILGASYSDTWHVIADLTTTKIKRWWHGKRRYESGSWTHGR